MAGTDGKPRGMKEYVDGLERRVAAMEKRMVVAVSLELERRVAALEDERLKRDVPLPAEPPGSPTVEEAEDRPRSECWEVRNKDGIVINHYKTDPGEMAQGRTKHRMVELQEGKSERDWLIDSYEEIRDECDRLQIERDQIQARVKELASENDRLRTELQGCALLAKEYSEKIAAFSENLCSRHLDNADG